LPFLHSKDLAHPCRFDFQPSALDPACAPPQRTWAPTAGVLATKSEHTFANSQHHYTALATFRGQPYQSIHLHPPNFPGAAVANLNSSLASHGEPKPINTGQGASIRSQLHACHTRFRSSIANQFCPAQRGPCRKVSINPPPALGQASSATQFALQRSIY